MKKLISVICILVLSVSAFAEVEIGYLDIEDANGNKVEFSSACCEENYYEFKVALYFNNPKDMDFWDEGIIPFALGFSQKNLQMFNEGLKKYFEWRDIAIFKSVSDIKKQIPLKEEFISAYKSSYLSYFESCEIKLHFQVRDEIPSLILEVDTYNYDSSIDKYYPHYYYFDEWQVFDLEYMFSEKSLQSAINEMERLKQEQDYFN